VTRKRKWTDPELVAAVKNSTSYRQVIGKLGLVEAGGNYNQIKGWIEKLKLSTSHFTGMAWNRGHTGGYKPIVPLSSILKKNTEYQSFKLKKRLFIENIFKQKCILCNWAEKSIDGRIPLELDHINGDRKDNRLENLRILCPNCHSLQSTHRGKNKKKY
jgi:hypothetical protein